MSAKVVSTPCPKFCLGNSKSRVPNFFKIRALLWCQQQIFLSSLPIKNLNLHCTITLTELVTGSWLYPLSPSHTYSPSTSLDTASSISRPGLWYRYSLIKRGRGVNYFLAATKIVLGFFVSQKIHQDINAFARISFRMFHDHNDNSNLAKKNYFVFKIVDQFSLI